MTQKLQRSLNQCSVKIAVMVRFGLVHYKDYATNMLTLPTSSVIHVDTGNIAGEGIMAPLIVLVVSALLFGLGGLAGVTAFRDLGFILRAALGLMFLFTASAHWGKRRQDLIRMVPPLLPHPHLLVTVTGILEILGAIGLLVPRTAPAACICLALLLLA